MRITPACAGKRNFFAAGATQKKDHPRMCGEKKCMFPEQSAFKGSPPHVRGKVGISVAVAGKIRITPACAGKRSYLSYGIKSQEDHPRMCGEKFE